MDSEEALRFEGCNFLRLRLVYSLLTGRRVFIDNIRYLDEEPGIRDHEKKLLEMIVNFTNKTSVTIDETGTELDFKPGVLLGGDFEMDFGNVRCLSYYLEPLVILAPFCKNALNVKLMGLTNMPNELSVDALRATWIPVYKKFVFADDEPKIKITARGLLPDGGGCVQFSAPVTRNLHPVQCKDAGKISKIRGFAFVTKVSPSLAHRMIDAAKQTLRDYIADVYITVDQRKGASGGRSPGFGLILTATTTEGVVYCGEAISKPRGEKCNPAVPEDIGCLAACRLLDDIYAGGCVSTSAQSLTSTYMALVPQDASEFLFGPLSVYCVHTLRHLRNFFEIVFKIDEWSKVCDEKGLRTGSDEKALLTCIGCGYTNKFKTVL